MSLTYFNGKSARTMATKSVGIGDLDRFLEFLVNEQTSDLNIDGLYEAVAFVYRGVQLRAQTLSALPFDIIRGETVIDTSDDYQNKLGWLPSPQRMLELLEQSLCVAGRAYWFISRNRMKPLSLQYWNPYTVEPDIDAELGLTGFTRKVNGKNLPFEIEDVFYVWPADYRVEIGPPQGSPVTAAFKAAGVLNSVDEFVKLFFEHGGVKNLIISAKGMTKESDRKNLLDWFKQTFRRGNKTAFEAAVVNAETLETIPIGQGIEGLDNEALTKERRESVSVAMGVPMSLFLNTAASGLGGGGVVEQGDIDFYGKTVEPEAEFIASVLNEQLFTPYGDYQFRFKFDSLDVYQVDEQKRALSFATYVQSDMRPEVAAYMLGLEIPEDGEIPPWYVDAFEKPQPIPAALAPAEEEELIGENVVDDALAAERAKEREELKKAADLDKWRKKAVSRFEEGKPEKALIFDSEYIPKDLYLQIVYSLKNATSVRQVEDVFDSLSEPGAELTYELKRANDLLEKTLEAA